MRKPRLLIGIAVAVVIGVAIGFRVFASKPPDLTPTGDDKAIYYTGPMKSRSGTYADANGKSYDHDPSVTATPVKP